MEQIRISQWRIAIYGLLFLGIALMGCSLKDREDEPVQSNDSLAEIRILFIGNSYTSANNFPEIFDHLAEQGGYKLQTTMLAPGGYTLSKHAESTETIEKIRQSEWDFVVLQEQSVIPSNPREREQSMYPAVRYLNTEIDSVGANTIMFLTWGRRDGLPESGFRDFEEMQTQITKGYLDIADELNVAVAPVGEAWLRILEQDSQLDLWQKDGSHPNVPGSYLAACVFYAVIFQESPEGLAFRAGLDEEQGYQLQSMAAKTVLGDLERWHIK